MRLKISIFSLLLLFFQNCGIKEKESESKPNIIIILADDLGFSDLGCYGSEISTPYLDSLANEGILFTNFYNTSKCSPSRAALLTGMYPHKAGLGANVSHLDKPMRNGPYQGYLSDSVMTIAEWLRKEGYQTGMSGKWHVGERPQHWPQKRGFDKYFGLISGASSYYEIIKGQKRKRQIVKDDTLWEPKNGFYMTDAITEYAIEFIKDNNDQSYFLYVAYTAPHWPLHAPEEVVNRYKGKYDKGWDVVREKRFTKQKSLELLPKGTILSPMPDYIEDWDTIEDKTTWSRRMEVYAAMVERMDAGVGRILNEVRDLENTVIIFASDNGGSHEDVSDRGLHDSSKQIGEKGSYESYQQPWALTSNTPFRKHKLYPFEGGIASPFILYNPLHKSELRKSNFKGHLIDILPTLIDVLNINPTPETNKKPLDGESIIAALEDDRKRRLKPLFFEYAGRKAVIGNNWKLLSDTDGKWQLYDIDQDRSESNDLKEENPEIVTNMRAMYNEWASEVGAH